MIYIILLSALGDMKEPYKDSIHLQRNVTIGIGPADDEGDAPQYWEHYGALPTNRRNTDAHAGPQDSGRDVTAKPKNIAKLKTNEKLKV
jgi:hypothetical protein